MFTSPTLPITANHHAVLFKLIFKVAILKSQVYKTFVSYKFGREVLWPIMNWEGQVVRIYRFSQNIDEQLKRNKAGNFNIIIYLNLGLVNPSSFTGFIE